MGFGGPAIVEKQAIDVLGADAVWPSNKLVNLRSTTQSLLLESRQADGSAGHEPRTSGASSRSRGSRDILPAAADVRSRWKQQESCCCSHRRTDGRRNHTGRRSFHPPSGVPGSALGHGRRACTWAASSSCRIPARERRSGSPSPSLRTAGTTQSTPDQRHAQQHAQRARSDRSGLRPPSQVAGGES